MKPRICVLGSANMDLVATTDHLPAAGETVLGHRFTTVPGGKGANQARAAARAGGAVTMIGAVGTDAFGTALREGLAADGVDTGLLRTVAGPSGVALIAVDAAGENQIVVAPGANAAVESLTGPELTVVEAAEALVCQMETPVAAVCQAAMAADQAGATVIINAAPAQVLPPELLRATHLLVVNAGEAEVVTGAAGAGLDELLGELVALVPRAVVTLGPAGAAYADRDGLRVDVPAPVITAIDSTAAGDAFVGALTVAWRSGRPVADALRWACAAGAACARTFGAAGSLPRRDAIDALYAETYAEDPETDAANPEQTGGMA